MALSATGFHDAVDHKIVVDASQTAVVVQKNVTTAPGRLYSVIVDCTKTSSNAYVKLYDGAAPVAGNTTPDWVVKGTAGTTTVYQIPFGYAFSELNFWISLNKAQADTTVPQAAVTVSLVCS
jgi:hypothetical protein|tara:strand:+ start:286 stop:651 length:366 start_codon:yes stop_codon:yes gene_type:complete